ncbi:MAG TPA: HD domain-containing protein [Erysipelotrichaceae bacterium]|jgi:putative hydrolase of HD superfamily|nr:HD domain-containing protein [Erysipelotrichaceae bacterium]HQA85308.1 HD domain-containing protein [Erysipelotrichaceae bacterium]
MKEKNVLQFYVLCNRLKHLIRSGWIAWNVKKDRVESVAEHIYSTQMLAIAMYSEFNYDIDLTKVLKMLAIHELEETIIGDFTPFQLDQEKKQEIGHKAILKALEPLADKQHWIDLIIEFDARKTKEAVFAYQCDKLECDLQAKLYDEGNCVDINNQENNKTIEDENVKGLLEKGYSWSQMWIKNDLNKINFDENFTKVNEYAFHNKISVLVKKED